MKKEFFLILCLLLLTIKCDSEKNAVKALCEENNENKSKDYCFGVYNETIKAKYNYTCCYLEAKLKNKPANGGIQEFKGCQRLHTDDDLDAWKKEFKENALEDDKTNEFETLEIVCDTASSSNLNGFLKLGLVSLFAALLI